MNINDKFIIDSTIALSNHFDSYTTCEIISFACDDNIFWRDLLTKIMHIDRSINNVYHQRSIRNGIYKTVITLIQGGLPTYIIGDICEILWPKRDYNSRCWAENCQCISRCKTYRQVLINQIILITQSREETIEKKKTKMTQ